MASKCEYSSIQIPNDPRYATAAASYVSEIARMIGMEKQSLKALEKAIIEAVITLIEYSFEPGETASMEISCERVPEGLQVSLRDKGLPFGEAVANSPVSEISADDAAHISEPLYRLKAYFDEIRLYNMGPDGKALILIQHLKNKSITDYYAACDLEPYQPTLPPITAMPAGFKCRVRQMKPTEAPEVSKTIYKTYGYTYPHEYVYYPDKINALNKSGRIFSAVAIAAEGEIAGYGVFQFWEENPQIVEMAQGAVKPEFRSLGCFRNITRYLLDQAKSRNVKGAFGEAVTNHTVSQHTVHGFGFKDCGLKLGLIPPETVFKGINEKISNRVSMLMQFLHFQLPPASAAVAYAPPQHSDMIAALYQTMGIKPEMKSAMPSKTNWAPATSVFKIKQVGSMNYARIIVERYGQNIVDEIKAKVKELCLKKTKIVNLFLNLSDPYTRIYTAQIEKLGFFFAGILPAGFPDGDALLLQYLNQVPINYDAIRIKSAIAKKLLDYVREHDPNLN